ASGVCLLQVVSNPYGMALGSAETKYQRMMWLHAFFAIGSTVAPLVAGPEILDESRLGDWQLPYVFTETQQGAGSVLLPYGVLGVILVLLGIISFCLPLPDCSMAEQKEKKAGCDSAWRYPHTIFGAVTAFFYIGTEVLIGSFIINYALSEQVDVGDMALSVLVSIYWGGILAGRLCCPWLMTRVPVAMMLVLAGLISAILLLVSILSAGLVAVVMVVLVGLFNSVMYPVIYSLAMKDMPPAVATQASGIVSTAGIGGALIPLLGGLIADIWGINAAFILSVFCYLVIAAYGIFAGKRNQKEASLSQ
nr:MFS transporter [Endozoicomonas sp.]